MRTLLASLLVLGSTSAPVRASPAGSASAPTGARIVALAAGGDSTCARSDGGDWRCWGNDTFGQLGTDPATVACGTSIEPRRCFARPTALAGIDHVVGLGLSGETTCALGADHAVRCWGREGLLGRGLGEKLEVCTVDGVQGPIGDLDLDTGKLDIDRSKLQRVSTPIPCSHTPVPVAGDIVASALAVGNSFACASTQDDVVCWGDNNDGRLGLPSDALAQCGDSRCAPVPTKLGVGPITGLTLGDESGAGITAAGAVVTWGSPLADQLGRKGGIRPAVVPGLDHVTQLALGSYFGCALLADGRVRCWGAGDGGCLGIGKIAKNADGLMTVSKPTLVPGLRGVTTIATSPRSSHVCAIVRGGALRCWGANSAGQLGVGDRHDRLVPVAVPGLTGVVALALGTLHTCALTNAGAVWCWGADHLAQLGTRVEPTTRCKLGYLSDDSSVPCALKPTRVDELRLAEP